MNANHVVPAKLLGDLHFRLGLREFFFDPVDVVDPLSASPALVRHLDRLLPEFAAVPSSVVILPFFNRLPAFRKST